MAGFGMPSNQGMLPKSPGFSGSSGMNQGMPPIKQPSGMGSPGGGMQMPNPNIGMSQGIPPMGGIGVPQLGNPQVGNAQMGGMNSQPQMNRMGGGSFGSPSPQIIAAIMQALGLGGNKQFGF